MTSLLCVIGSREDCGRAEVKCERRHSSHVPAVTTKDRMGRTVAAANTSQWCCHGDEVSASPSPGSVERQAGTCTGWICLLSGYSDLFALVSRGQARRNIWGAPGGNAAVIGQALVPGLFSKTCGRLRNEQITATKTDSIVPA